MSEQVGIAIIGAGFGGIGMAIRLKQAGFSDLVLLEKQEDLGGCWHDNTYPGAACDVPSHLYSFSFEPFFDWSRRFAPQPEIQAYLRHCAHKYDVTRHIRFGVEVRAATFDEQADRWRIELDDGTRLEAGVLITATGQLNRPFIPDLPGTERFRGERFHSARWNHDYDLNGKRVAVIGTGASAIQFVPHVAQQAKQLYLFQRSAAYVLKKPDRAWKPWERRLMEQHPTLQWLDRARIYTALESRALGFVTSPTVLQVYRQVFRRHLNRQIKDPELRRKLTPDYPLGCKRILISNDYYPALAQDNVELIDEPVREITETGVVAADGRERDVDAIIYGTGFRASEFLSPIHIVGRNGRELNREWRGGAEAYLGITVHGFPNLFMLYGPNTNLGHNSIIYMLESQFHYVLECLKTLRDENRHWLDVRDRPQSDFNKELQEKMRKTVWQQGCDSWYLTESGKNTNNWPDFTFAYRRATRQLTLDDYELSPQ